MNTKKKSLKLCLIISLMILFFIPSFVNATELNGINVYVDLLKNGDGNITMVWDYYDDYGTEHYIPINGRGISIENFMVSKNGVEYEILDSWDVNANQEEKKDKAGILYDGSKYELCWGIGDYGQNEFTISYTVKDIIKNLEDAQMLHYRFINDNLSEPPKNIYIEIRGFENFKKEDILMWGFGFDGEVQNEDGIVRAKSFGPLGLNDYAHILLKFKPDYFDANPESYVDMTFEEVKDNAFDGSDYNDYGSDFQKGESKLGSIIFAVLIFIVTGGIFVAVITVVLVGIKSATNLKINPSDYKDQYYREIPYKGDPIKLYAILMPLFRIDYTNYTTYFFLKWMKDGHLEKFNYEKGVVFKKEKTGFKIIDTPQNVSSVEKKLFNFLIQASGPDRMLEENEFNKWMGDNSDKFENYLSLLDSYSESCMINEGYLEYEKQKVFGLSADRLTLTDEGKELAANLIKFKNYLTDFSLLNERESINIHIWDDLMLYAAIYGITEVVEKEFNKLYPNYFEQTNIDMTTIYLANYYSRSITSSYHSASSSSSSSGFGGGTSMGGGGGGFGGGSGGGTR